MSFGRSNYTFSMMHLETGQDLNGESQRGYIIVGLERGGGGQEFK